MSRVDVSGVLLAGGTSRRLGGDKAMAEIGGYPLLARVAAAAQVCCEELVVVTADRQAHTIALSTAGLPADAVVWAEDRRPDRGPLAGIEAGLGTATRPVCLLLSCDLPFLRPAPLLGLVGELGERRGRGSRRPRIACPLADGRRQPLCSACDRDAGDAASVRLDEGEGSVAAWLDLLQVLEVPAEELPGAPREGEPAWWTDVDEPDALARARAAAGDSSRRGPAPGTPARPASRLVTDRLVLDAAGPRFAREIYDAYAGDPEVTRLLLWEPHASLGETVAFLGEKVREWEQGEAFVWVIREREEDGDAGPAVGAIGLRPRAEHDQVGYAVARDRWGRGYATEALERVLGEAVPTLGLEEVSITVHPENAASIRVLEKAGLERTGTVAEHGVFPNLGDDATDCYLYRYRPSSPPERKSP